MKFNAVYHKSALQIEQEASLIALAKKNPEDFEGLYNKYHKQIFSYINNRVENRDLAFDLTSQVFLKALNNLHKYEFKGVPFSSWLYRIAKSEVYQAFRENKSARVINVDFSTLGDIFRINDEEIKSPIEVEEQEKRLLKLLKKLKQDEITMIEMRFFEKRSFKEIADILYITENNAKVKCFRIIKKLKDLI